MELEDHTVVNREEAGETEETEMGSYMRALKDGHKGGYTTQTNFGKFMILIRA